LLSVSGNFFKVLTYDAKFVLGNSDKGDNAVTRLSTFALLLVKSAPANAVDTAEICLAIVDDTFIPLSNCIALAKPLILFTLLALIPLVALFAFLNCFATEVRPIPPFVAAFSFMREAVNFSKPLSAL
jgi:hypothetical protein